MFRLAGHIALVPLIAAAMTVDVQASKDKTRGFAMLEGWRGDDHGAALATFQRSCPQILKTKKLKTYDTDFGPLRDWQGVCRKAMAMGRGSGKSAARRFFENNFQPVEIMPDKSGRRLFTGYFEPEMEGSRVPTSEHTIPLLRRPDDLVRLDGSGRKAKQDDDRQMRYGRRVDGRLVPYFTRGEIEKGALSGRGLELVYLKDRLDAYFLHIQGSGRISLADGSKMRVSFAGKNGRPYTSIGRQLVEWGEMTVAQASMQSIRRWIGKNPQRANDLLWKNQSYIFFQELVNFDSALGPPGAQGVPLTPERSLAVDRRHYFFGIPLWVDTTAPIRSYKDRRRWRRLMVAQDTGSAIIGRVRGDIFWGTGSRAGEIAGRMNSTGRLFALRPLPQGASD